MGDKYFVDLSDAEQEYLLALLKKGKTSVRTVTRAHILLQAAEEATDEEIAEALRIGVSTVHRTRQRFVEEGLPAALTERARCGCGRKLDGKQEAFLVALACSAPPPGRNRWTMPLLADRFVELQVVEQVSDETVRRVRKKTISSRGREKHGAFPVSVLRSFGTWRMCWISTPSPMTPSDRKSVLINGSDKIRQL